MRNKIIFWVATLWACLGMTSTALVQVFHLKANVDFITHLGYPDYFLKIIGTWKILGVIALLIPKFPLLKEWAYAGFFFLMSGAVISHIAYGDPFLELLPSLWLLILIVVSYSFRPTGRRLTFAHQ